MRSIKDIITKLVQTKNDDGENDVDYGYLALDDGIVHVILNGKLNFKEVCFYFDYIHWVWEGFKDSLVSDLAHIHNY